MAHQCHYHTFSLLSAKYPLYVIILKEKWPTRHYRMIRWRWLAYNPLQWRHNECDVVSNHQPHDCLLNCLFRRRSKKTPKLRVTGLCAGNSPVTGESPAQMASNAENVSIWWRHHAIWTQHQWSSYWDTSVSYNRYSAAPLWTKNQWSN